MDKMDKIGKKAFVIRTFYMVIAVLAIILLFFLIKNNWDVGEAFNNVLRLLKLK